MRIFLTSIFLLFIINLSAQNKLDTLNVLETKAREYLKQTYANQNLDLAIPQWHGFVFLEIREIYKKKKDTISNFSDVRKRLEQDYKLFYNSNKNFVLLKFDDKTISDESKTPSVYFKYTYEEDINGIKSNGTSYLYFIFDKGEWKILDFRISEILGEPTRWLK